MQKFKLLFILLIFSVKGFSQVADSTNFSIYYSSPKEYIIEGIEIKGVRYLDKDVLIQLSGLAVGDEIQVPGEAITDAIKKLWGQGLFSDIRIEAEKIVNNKIWLALYLQERPRLSDVHFHGISKSEQKDVTEKVLLLKGSQVTDNQLNNAQRIIKDLFHGKGFLNTEVNIVQRDDSTQANSVILDINVDKKEKVKIEDIVFHGTNNVRKRALEKAMKKTRAKKIRNFFSSKKFQENKYVEDKVNLIKKYNEKGYRDATIVKDSITPVAKNRVRLDLWIEEGDKYYFRNIKWVGNTVYPGEFLSAVLGIKKGDVFDQKLLDKRLTEDEDGVGSQYQNNGYLFYNLDPVETNIQNDSIDFEMRIYEGKQATINRIKISGNTKTNEHVARRELRTLPGDLFSKDLLMRSYRELAQLGHFDPEAIHPDVIPHPEDGTVDINYELVEKANDQIELSGGWGARMFVGSLGLKFSNFSVRNIAHKEAWRPLPTGDGQTLSLRAQTSGKFYQQYSLSFLEPWLGGHKPNSFSLSLSYSRVNYSANSYYSNYNSPYGYNNSYYYGYSPYGYGYSTDYSSDESTDQIQLTTAISVGYGYRLSWPDDYFTLYHEVSWEHYSLKNMASYYYFLSDNSDDNTSGNGEFNNFSIKTTFGRNSIDNPLYSRSGSSLALSLQMTPPYSLFNGINYSDPSLSNEERYRWIEYHKWLLKGSWFIPISPDNKLVLHGAFEYGFLGYYDRNRRSPFGRFRLGGSGMSGYNLYGSDIIALRGYKDYSLSPNTGSNLYNKLTVEMRYPVSLKPSATIYLLSFFEAGNAWMEFKDYSPYKLKRSAGVGVRIFLPMFGLMGIDWGYGFDEISGSKDYSGSQFHFVIGQQF